METACGGLFSSSIVSCQGASKIYKGGLVLYTLSSRVTYGGWTQLQADEYRGPVPEISAGLAKHIRASLGSTYTLAEDGTARPTGGTALNRIPGYVAFAVDGETGSFTREYRTSVENDRTENMLQFALQALIFLRDVIEGKAES